MLNVTAKYRSRSYTRSHGAKYCVFPPYQFVIHTLLTRSIFLFFSGAVVTLVKGIMDRGGKIDSTSNTSYTLYHYQVQGARIVPPQKLAHRC
jgi:hypothetical protein